MRQGHDPNPLGLWRMAHVQLGCGFRLRHELLRTYRANYKVKL